MSMFVHLWSKCVEALLALFAVVFTACCRLVSYMYMTLLRRKNKFMSTGSQSKTFCKH